MMMRMIKHKKFSNSLKVTQKILLDEHLSNTILEMSKFNNKQKQKKFNKSTINLWKEKVKPKDLMKMRNQDIKKIKFNLINMKKVK